MARVLGLAEVPVPGDDVVEVGEQFVGRQVDVGECSYRGAQPAHGRRGANAVADHVAHDQGDPGPRQGDDVVPVAAHSRVRTRGEVARGRGHRRLPRCARRQEAPLQRQGGVVLPGVVAGVVHAHRGPVPDLLCQEQVVGVEGIPAREACEECRAQGHPAGAKGDRQRGAYPARAGVAAFGRQGGGGVGDLQHSGLAREQPEGRFRALPVDDGIARLHRLRGRGRSRHRGTAQGEVARAGPQDGFVALKDAVEEVHVGVVGEAVHGDLDQFLGGPSRVESASDTAAGLTEEREPFASDHEPPEARLAGDTDPADGRADNQGHRQCRDDRDLVGAPHVPKEDSVERDGGGQVEHSDDHGLPHRKQGTGHDRNQDGVLGYAHDVHVGGRQCQSQDRDQHHAEKQEDKAPVRSNRMHAVHLPTGSGTCDNLRLRFPRQATTSLREKLLH